MEKFYQQKTTTDRKQSGIGKIQMQLKQQASYPLRQCFQTSSTHTTGGTQKVVVWWYAKTLGNYDYFYDLVSKILIALI
jgi:hypothetical protein